MGLKMKLPGDKNRKYLNILTRRNQPEKKLDFEIKF